MHLVVPFRDLSDIRTSAFVLRQSAPGGQLDDCTRIPVTYDRMSTTSSEHLQGVQEQRRLHAVSVLFHDAHIYTLLLEELKERFGIIDRVAQQGRELPIADVHEL